MLIAKLMGHVGVRVAEDTDMVKCSQALDETAVDITLRYC